MHDTDGERTTNGCTDACCGGSTREHVVTDSGGQWVGELGLDLDLPDPLQTALGRFFGVESVATLEDWSDQIRRQTGGGSIEVGDLCHADSPTDHWGEIDGERYHFQCFYDAVILAALEDRPVQIQTVSPGGEVIRASADQPAELFVTPSSAVFSLGIAHDAYEQTAGDPTMADAYAAICPYVKAFPDRESYDAWAADAPAETVAAPLSGATTFVRSLTEEGSDD
jgi:hypothetical protein